MATLTKRKRDGCLMFEIQWYADGRRKTIPLGKKFTEKTARELHEVVEVLLHCKTNGIEYPGKRTVNWIESANKTIRDKLAKAGLIEVPPSHTLEELWEMFIKQKSKEVKESTLNLYYCVKERFFLFFKPDELLDNLTKERMQSWKDYLLEEVATATASCYLKQCKTAFNWATARGWWTKSPLDGISPGSTINKKNDRFISMDIYFRLLDAAPCKDWRCIISLARIGGLRCPNEVLNLRWEDVNWEHDHFFVRSPKTEHHDGKEGRLVPLFPELKKELESLWFDQSSEGRKFVINRYRDAAQNLRTTFGKIVKRAGLEMFPRPFDNMRMTRSNEVYRKWGAFLESQWIGHSRRVREDHYLSITDADFQLASEWSTPFQEAKRRQGEEKCRKKMDDFGFPAILPATDSKNESQTASSEK